MTARAFSMTAAAPIATTSSMCKTVMPLSIENSHRYSAPPWMHRAGRARRLAGGRRRSAEGHLAAGGGRKELADDCKSGRDREGRVAITRGEMRPCAINTQPPQQAPHLLQVGDRTQPVARLPKTARRGD